MYNERNKDQMMLIHLDGANHVVIYLITNIVYVVVRAKPKAMQHANPYHINSEQ